MFKTEEYIPIPTVEGTPIVTPAPIQNDSEDDSYIQTQENEALGKSNIEDCILLMKHSVRWRIMIFPM